MKVDFDHIEHLISMSDYGSIAKFFELTNIMTAQNYYKQRRNSKALKLKQLQQIAAALGCDVEILYTDEQKPSKQYHIREIDLMSQLLREKDERINYLTKRVNDLESNQDNKKDKGDKKDKKDNDQDADT